MVGHSFVVCQQIGENKAKLDCAIPFLKYLNMIKDKFTSDNAAKFFDINKITAMLDEEHFAKPDNWRKVWCI